MKRKIIHNAKRDFARGNRIHKKNLHPKPTRGGIRL